MLARGALAALAFACAPGCVSDRTAPAARDGGPPASGSAQVRVLDLDGAPRDLWPRGRSPVTVVVFTRTDCPVSNRFAPEVRQLVETYRARGVDFYLVYVDPSEDAPAIRRHLHDFGYSCPALRDPHHALVAYCHATITPEAAVFGRDRTLAYLGRISDLYEDPGNRRAAPTRHDLADAIEATVQGRPVATPRTPAVGCVIADLKG
jgi:hypothetical protein